MTPDDRTPAPSAINGLFEDPPQFYDRHVFVCTNERPPAHPRGCCKARGSVELRDYMKARAKELGLKNVRINSAGCMERCELGPSLVIYPEGVWYRPQSREDIDEILATHMVAGGRVTRLMLKPGDDPPPVGKTPKKPA